MDNVSIWGIVLAAGRGTRFGGPKHTMRLNGKPLWVWARDSLFAAGVSHVVLVGDVPGGVPGGNRRRDSVAAGLAEIPSDVEFIIVHDATRPLASKATIESLIDTLLDRDADGVVPAVPVRDTLKQVGSNDVVAATVPRDYLVAVQTPQGFRANALRAAHAASEDDATDDALLVERNGGRVVVVAGDPRNLKVTYPEDLAVVRALAAEGDGT
jgi:2-C-methyl-D-erythritol 4-phosphate cytidylyltransferase